jgi:hypothetical protein
MGAISEEREKPTFEYIYRQQKEAKNNTALCSAMTRAGIIAHW